MNNRLKQQRIRQLEQRCRERDIPCTIQRRAVLEEVLGRDDHPTADQVFDALRKTNRGISRATVHRTLEFLVNLGVITKACHPGKATRYDGLVELHHHLVCMHCDRMIDYYDERLNELAIPDTAQSGFEVHDFRVQLRGVCRDCRGKGKGVKP